MGSPFLHSGRRAAEQADLHHRLAESDSVNTFS
jgi:hypothetical protein